MSFDDCSEIIKMKFQSRKEIAGMAEIEDGSKVIQLDHFYSHFQIKVSFLFSKKKWIVTLNQKWSGQSG